jgi:hypothetical protein
MGRNDVYVVSNINPGDRLPPDFVTLLVHVATPLGAASATLMRQAEAATVVRFSATMVDVLVPSEEPLLMLGDGPVPTHALVYEGDSLVGELLVWVRSGRLIGVEQMWYTAQPPTGWPSPDQVKVS